MKHTILYVPGLGDTMPWLIRWQKWALQLWRTHGVRIEVFPMEWTESSSLMPRFDALTDRIDELHAAGTPVSLVGVSAGASVVIPAFVQKNDKITGLVTICGKIHGEVAEAVKQANPRFNESLRLLEQSLLKLTPSLKERLLTIYSPHDIVVPPRDAVVEGAHKLEARALGHNPTCAYVLLCKARSIVGFFKSISSTTKTLENH